MTTPTTSTITSTLTGTDGRDTLQGTSGPDLILGLAGDDVLMGGDGDDTLVGGLGADLFYASEGNDTYVIDGVSRDVLGIGYTPIPYISDPSSVQTVKLPAGITPDNLLLRSDGFDLTLRLADPIAPTGVRDILYVWRNDRSPNEPRFIDRIVFDNGVVWGAADIDNVLDTQRLRTTTGDDVVEGGARDDSVRGLTGNDYMSGGGGNDTLAGDEGRDLLTGNEGDDSLLGGDGDDTVYGDEGNDTLLGGQGSDVLDGGEGADFVSGGSGDDVLYSAGGAGVLDGGDGNDLLSAGSSFGYATTSEGVLMLGGSGDDDFVAFLNATMEGGAGADTYELGAASVAGEGNVIRFGVGGGPDGLKRGSAELEMASGVKPGDVAVRLDVGSLINLGQDYALVDALGLRVELPGDQDVFVVLNQWTATGGIVDTGGLSGIDFADGTHWDQAVLQAKYAQGTANDDLILGFTGRDNTLTGQGGGDRLYGMEGQDLLIGGAGDDLMLGQYGDDTLQGGTGNDTLNGGLGRDSLVGGAGDDTYVFTRNKAGYSVLDLTGDGAAPSSETERVLMAHGLRNSDIKLSRDGVDLIIESRYLSEATRQPERMRVLGQFKLDNQGREAGLLDKIVFLDDLSWSAAEIAQRSLRVENLVTEGSDEIFGDSQANALEGRGGQDQLFGFDGNDTLSGGDGSDVLDGGAGNDLLTGGAQFDTLIGGDGNDTLDGGLGADTMTGGAGDDYYYVDSADDEVIEVFNNYAAGVDTVATNLSDYTMTLGVDNLVMGGKAGDAPDARNLLSGKAGVRHGVGNDSANVMTGGLGSERFEGLYGDDTLRGFDGDDTLEGGVGRDLLDGGVGNDTYVLSKALEIDYRGDVVADTIIESAGDAFGVDTVITDFVSYTAPDNIEQVFSTGLFVNGNVLNNLLRGGVEQNNLAGRAGDDTLEGGGGNDQYNGGLGNDLLVAAATDSNDTYVWGKGAGADTLRDAGGQDRLIIESGVQTEQLWFSREGDALKVAIIGTADSFKVDGWYQGTEHQVEEIGLSGGKSLAVAKVQQLVDAMASFTPPAQGQTTLPADVAAKLAPVIASAWA